MASSLLFQALAKYTTGLAVTAALLFIPAGTFHFWQGWLFIGILFIPMLAAGIWLMLRNPDLLRKRLDAKEEHNEQKQVVAFSALLFIAAFVVAGLGVRLQWHLLPDWIVFAAAALFLIGYAMYAEVMRENVWLSRTIEVQEHQKVVDTGLYGVVRHPMYAATLLLFLTIPLILASLWAFLIMLLYIPVIAKRIRNEEAVLEQGLNGYYEYKKRVRYKVIPFIW